jgi:DNA-binding phage protein
MKNRIRGMFSFSRKARINVFKLLYYTLSPHPKLKLTDALKISNALGVSIENLIDSQIDIQRVSNN